MEMMSEGERRRRDGFLSFFFRKKEGETAAPRDERSEEEETCFSQEAQRLQRKRRRKMKRRAERSQFLTRAVDSIGIANSLVNVAVVVECGRSHRTRRKHTCKKRTSHHTLHARARTHTPANVLEDRRYQFCPNAPDA